MGQCFSSSSSSSSSVFLSFIVQLICFESIRIELKKIENLKQTNKFQPFSYIKYTHTDLVVRPLMVVCCQFEKKREQRSKKRNEMNSIKQTKNKNFFRFFFVFLVHISGIFIDLQFNSSPSLSHRRYD